MRFIILALLLAGCGTVVPATIARLYATQPLNADPAAVQVALALPMGLGLRPNTTRLQIDVTRQDGKESATGEFILLEQAGDTPAIDPQDGLVRSFRLSETDAAKLRAIQARARAWKAEVPRIRSSLTLNVNFKGCAIGQGPARSSAFSIFVRTDAEGAMMPLVRQAKLMDLLGTTFFDNLRPCDEPL